MTVGLGRSGRLSCAFSSPVGEFSRTRVRFQVHIGCLPGGHVSVRLPRKDPHKIVIDLTAAGLSDDDDEVPVEEDVAPSQMIVHPQRDEPSVGETANAAAEQTTTQMTSGSASAVALLLPSREILRHCPICPCHGCTLDREDPNPFSSDPVARRKELKRRSNLHNKYRDSVGRNTINDPGPRKYRPNRARVQQRA